MNIQTDAIVINQCERNDYTRFERDGGAVDFYSFAERGVGLSRNSALMRATADICLFGDDDVTYVDNYEDIIRAECARHPDADVIVFNLKSVNPNRPTAKIRRWKRGSFYNCLRYSTPQMSIRRMSVYKANVSFSLLFGGGAKYSSGEDSLFIMDCTRKGLRVYASPSVIGTVPHGESSWFEGYADKYFIDKGALFACMTKRWARLMCVQFCLRHRKLLGKEKKWSDALSLMLRGVKEFRESGC